MRKFFAQGPWSEAHLTAWITIIMMAVNIGLGLVIIAGGIDRFAIPSYSPLISYSHGNIWIWGAWIALAALLMTTPFRWISIGGLWLSMCWHIVWMACFTVAVVQYDNAVATPIPIHAGLSMISAALLTARVIDIPKE